nr:LOW QUALITY PROTEIN: serine/threonine-protein kinase MRCK alpha-like [Dasypus novemcinctus]
MIKYQTAAFVPSLKRREPVGVSCRRRVEKDAQGLTSETTKEVESLKNFSLVPGATNMPGEMDGFDTLDVPAVLELDAALGRESSKQVVAEGPPLRRDCEMKAKEKYQSDLWLETERLSKGIMQQDPNPSSLALFNTTTKVVDQCETDPAENLFEQNLKTKFYISSESTSPSSHSGDEADPVKIVDSAHLPVHTPTISRKEYQSRILFSIRSKTHQFSLTSFTVPTKCHQCTSLMVGLVRQGYVCEACGFSCHTTCVEKVPRACPVPSQQKGPLCLDPQKSMGTAYEGHVWIPKKTGVKKGWQRALAIVCDFKLFLYEIDEEKTSKPSVVVSQVIDMRDGALSVSSIWPSEFIPIKRKEMPRIFKVTTSQLSAPSNTYSIPLLADSKNEKSEWVGVLRELHTILEKSPPRDRSVYVLKEACGSSLPLLRTTQAAAITGTDLYHNLINQVGPSPAVPKLKSGNLRLFTTQVAAKPDLS